MATIFSGGNESQEIVFMPECRVCSFAIFRANLKRAVTSPKHARSFDNRASFENPVAVETKVRVDIDYGDICHHIRVVRIGCHEGQKVDLANL